MRLTAVFLAFSLAYGAELNFTITPDVQAVLDHVSANSMRGHLSFLASDLLEGRATPSRGLDLAAEYIAAQFRRVGLEPAGDDGYFQTAKFVLQETNWTGFTLTLSGSKTFTLGQNNVAVQAISSLDLADLPVVKIDMSDQAAFAERPDGELEGKVAAIVPSGNQRGGAFRAINQLVRLRPALVLTITESVPSQPARPRLIDPDQPTRTSVPVLTVGSKEVLAAFESAPAGDTGFQLKLHLTAPIDVPVKLRNVAGLLRGSDPVLKDQYIIVTAHYDHLGVRVTGDDHIFNGANDDGSGTVSVIEIAGALATMKLHPRRSILFMTVFGEEMGDLGSHYYGRHPLFPLAKTIADVNLEQMGRTDQTGGPQVGTASFTGFDYSDLPAIFEAVGKQTGVTVYKDEKRNDPYFSRSDNQALADVGVPAHTLCVAFEYPDYHGAGDHWDKIDYDNMAKVDRMVTAGLLVLAGDAPPPRWNDANPKAARYVEASKKLHAGN